MTFWKECVSEAFDEAKITATGEQVEIVASWVEGAHENYGMAHGHDCIPNPLVTENKKLKQELRDEKDKIICEVCKGKGTLYSSGGTFEATSSCWKCKGEGRYLPK